MSEDNYATPLFVALYGTYTATLPDAGADELERDPLWLFNEISRAMGWLDTRSVRVSGDGPPRLEGTPGLWNANDAGLGSPLHRDGSQGPVIWFSVTPSPSPAADPLPIHQLMSVASASVQRLGSFELGSAQFAIPASPPGERPGPRSLAAVGPLSRPPLNGGGIGVRVEIASGSPDAFDDDALECLGTAVVETVPDYFRITAPPRRMTAPMVLPISDAVWDGPCASAMSLECEIGEWTFGSVGWLVAHLAELLTVVKRSTPVAITISRTATNGES